MTRFTYRREESRPLSPSVNAQLRKEKVVDLTTDVVSLYVGGQLEIQNSVEHYLYRGEIKSAEVEPGGADRQGYAQGPLQVVC